MKKIIIPIIVVILVLVAVFAFITIKRNKIASKVLMDINPSFQINLDKDDNVIDVIGLSNEGLEIVGEGIKKGTLDEVLSYIVDQILEREYVRGDDVNIVLYSDGEINKDDLKNKVSQHWEERGRRPNIIVIDKITKEDEKLARDFQLSLSKAAYINSILDADHSLKPDDIVDKSISEILELENHGIYCDHGYTLDNGRCIKEVSRTPAVGGEVCPRGYREYNGNCYKEIAFIDGKEYFCNDNEELRDDKCYRSAQVTPKFDSYKCDNGTKITCEQFNGEPENPNSNCYKCVDESRVEKPGYICVVKKDGVCYGGKGKPYYEGKCINGDIEYNGQCYEKRQYEYVCSNGRIVKSKDSYCSDDPAITDAIPAYYCDAQDGELVGDRCVKEEIRDASVKKICPEGSMYLDESSCIDLNQQTAKENGLVCEEENAVYRYKECIIYEEKEPRNK